MASKRKLVSNFLILVATSSLAQQGLGQLSSSANEVTDHPLFDRFAYSQIVEADFEEDTNYRIVLGSLQRTRGAVTAEDSQLVRGDLTRIVYEVSQEFDGRDVYDFFLEQMEERGYSQLYTCQGRGCGSSNYWANDIFGNRILYGPESNQFYLVMRTNLGLEQEPHIAAYIITRANRRIYAYLEIIEIGGSRAPVYHLDTDELLNSLRQNGSVVLPRIGFTANDGLDPDTELEYLAELLLANPEVQVYLVSHVGGATGLDTLLNRSRTRAQNVRARLLQLGVPPQQVDAQGVGPLAPFCDGFGCSERIELVLQESAATAEQPLPADQ